MIDLTALSALAKAATPGPYGLVEYDGPTVTCSEGIFPYTSIDHHFIHAASPDVILALVEVCRAAQRIPRKPSMAHILLTPGWDELQTALTPFREGK